MFLSRSPFGDASDAAAMATSNASTAPGLTTSSQNAGPATVPASCTCVTRTAVVDAVYSWTFEVPAIETRPDETARGTPAAAPLITTVVAAAVTMASMPLRVVRRECRSVI